ncbi:hypothetical protein [Bryocella elongata]|nr:hypothetical protein [Bryocella elongata]
MPTSMDANTRELFEQSMQWSDHFYDDGAKLVRSPYSTGAAGAHGSAGRYMVRESSWYALGLLFRDQDGDRGRAAQVIEKVLDQQYTVPGVRWYGTYKRTPEEPTPTGKSVMWRGYDPNWRHFIGTTFAMILIEYPDRVPASLRERMYKAIDLAVVGEMQEGRLVPSYTNIALMYGFLWDFAAVHDHRADWLKQSADWNDAVNNLFSAHHAFFEYNSPTYCGVDLYGLALWRNYGSSAHLRDMGSTMEISLWRDLMKYYQPSLRNLSGPFDRSYGMDMESYVSVVGVWMRTMLDAKHAPLPPLVATTDHLPDLWFAPHIAILGLNVPDDARAKMTHFSGPHLVRQEIDDKRTATAWIGNNVIFGGEITSFTKDAGPTSQFHPATVQWRTPSGQIGWVLIVECPPINASADEHGLSIDTKDANSTIKIQIHAKGTDKAKLLRGSWSLPGLQIKTSADAKDFTVTGDSDNLYVTYTGLHHMRLEIPESK